MTELDPADVRLDALLLAERIAVGWEVEVLDLRSPAEIAAQGEVPDARPARAAALREGEVVLDDAISTVLICALGSASTAAALALRAAGHPDVWSVDGGAPAWLRAVRSVL